MSDFSAVFAEIVAASEAYAPRSSVVGQMEKVQEEFSELLEACNRWRLKGFGRYGVMQEAADLIIATTRLIHEASRNPGEVVAAKCAEIRAREPK